MSALYNMETEICYALFTLATNISLYSHDRILFNFDTYTRSFEYFVITILSDNVALKNHKT